MQRAIQQVVKYHRGRTLTRYNFHQDRSLQVTASKTTTNGELLRNLEALEKLNEQTMCYRHQLNSVIKR